MSLAHRPARSLSWLVAPATVALLATAGAASAPAATQARADAVAPRVAVTSPRPQSRVRGVVRAGIRVRDNRRVRRVIFRLDGRRIAVRRRAPYTVRLNTRRLRNGRHSLRATAYDQAGNHRTRAVRFTVTNQPKARPEPVQAAATLAVGASGGVGTFTPVKITGRTFYVSPAGSDANDGTSPEQAWRTVRQANR